MPEARQEKFAASVSSIFKGQNSAVQQVRAEVTSGLPAASDIIHNNIADNATKPTSALTAKNSVSGDGNKVARLNTADMRNPHADASPTVGAKEVDVPVISTTDSKYPPAIISEADIHGTNMTSKNPFDPIVPDPVSERSFMQRLTFSFRAGEGKAPGSEQALTGSLLEVKASYDISDIFVAKISVGDFMPYETQAVTATPQFNSDGFRLLQLTPVMQYRAILGAEIGAKFNMFSAPFEATAGFIDDLQGNFIPRFGFFTSLSLQDNLSMNIGLEGMIYNHDITSSLRNAQTAYASEHPSLVGQLQQTESTGFIGPAIEMVWHF